MVIITNSNYVDIAEDAIQGLIADARKIEKKPGGYKIITTSQIRNQLAMTTEMYSEVANSNDDQLSGEILDKIEYLRIRFAYQAGREDLVRKFIEKTHILSILKSIKGNKADFLIFCRYMEALVAFRKYYGNRDD